MQSVARIVPLYAPRTADLNLIFPVGLQVPKVREGGYVPTFIEHRKRSEQALVSVIQEAVLKESRRARPKRYWMSWGSRAFRLAR